VVQGVFMNSDEKKLFGCLKRETTAKPCDKVGQCNVALSVNVKFTRSKSENAELVRVTTDPDATPVRLTKEDIREKYPWDYRILTTRLRKRYSDFKENAEYHSIRKPLEEMDKYCKKRFLDPAQKKGIGKCFYNSNIVKEFDAHYTRSN